MPNLSNYIFVTLINFLIRSFRLPGLNSTSIYAIWLLPFMQPYMEKLGRMKAYEVYRKAKVSCPAYKEFLNRKNSPEIYFTEDFSNLPETNKPDYVKAYSIEARCHGGAIPRTGVVIDESSGSSGTPNNWVRSREDRGSVKRLLQHAYTFRIGNESVIFLNCFALGPWATGMNISMALADLVILKSLGPDKTKLDNSLREFGTKYKYAIAGYPPFLKDWFSSTTLDLSQFELHLLVGGEGLSEGLRDFFLKYSKSVYSSYGASDLEINIGAETEFTIALRRQCLKNPSLSKKLFGREDAPMIFQYNPVDYLIEQSPDKEVVVTVLRLDSAAPKVRYNIKDNGGSITFRRCAELLQSEGISASALARQMAALPLLFVFGRNDLSVPFYGAKIFSTDIDWIINRDPNLLENFFGFQLKVEEDEALEKTLFVHLERMKNSDAKFSDLELGAKFYELLKEINQDFREVSKMFTPNKLQIIQHQFGTGPFEGRDIRLKNKYIS